MRNPRLGARKTPHPNPSPGEGLRRGGTFEDVGRFAKVSQERGIKAGADLARLTSRSGAFPEKGRGGERSARRGMCSVGWGNVFSFGRMCSVSGPMCSLSGRMCSLWRVRCSVEEGERGEGRGVKRDAEEGAGGKTGSAFFGRLREGSPRDSGPGHHERGGRGQEGTHKGRPQGAPTRGHPQEGAHKRAPTRGAPTWRKRPGMPGGRGCVHSVRPMCPVFGPMCQLFGRMCPVSGPMCPVSVWMCPLRRGGCPVFGGGPWLGTGHGRKA